MIRAIGAASQLSPPTEFEICAAWIAKRPATILGTQIDHGNRSAISKMISSNFGVSERWGKICRC